MLAARLTFSGSPSISRLLSSRWVCTPSPASINRMFSSRVPKRLYTPRLMRTLDFIKWVLDTSKQGKIDDKAYRSIGKDSKLRPPAGTGCRTPSATIIPRSVKAPVDGSQGFGRRDADWGGTVDGVGGTKPIWGEAVWGERSRGGGSTGETMGAVSYTHLRAHETDSYL